MSNQQKRDSKGRFAKTSKNSGTVKIYGDSSGKPWNDNYFRTKLDPDHYFLVDLGWDFYFYDPIKNSKSKFSNYRADIDSRINRVWKEIPYSTLQREFPSHMDKIDQILGLSNKQILSKQVEDFRIDQKLAIDDIKIGSLYYNFGDCTVCRIIEVVGRLIYASWHKGPATPYGVSSFRKATKEEIDNYLKEAEELKGLDV